MLEDLFLFLYYIIPFIGVLALAGWAAEELEKRK